MKIRLKSLLAILILSVIPATAMAHPTTAGDDPSENVKQETPSPEERVSFLLSAIHELPPKDAFEQIPGARRILEQTALDFDALFQRRAIAALGYYPDDSTLQIWKSLLKHSKATTGLKMQLLTLIGNYFKNEEGLSILQQYLNNSDPDIRIGAIYGLSNIKNESSFKILNDRFSKEKDPYVMEKLKKYTQMVR